jgi:hypothetical protein
MLGFGLGCALFLALVGAVAAELYLRAKEAEIKGAVTREVDPPSIDAPPAQTKVDTPPTPPEKPPETQKPPVEQKPPEVKVTEPAKVEPTKVEPAKVEPPKVDAPKVDLLPSEPGKPQMVVPKIDIKHDAGDLTPEKRKIYYDDKQFGYRHMANTCGTETKKAGEKIIYKATYTSDEFGRRITPHVESPEPEHAVICMGCSFTFGLGVNDDQTMPWQLALQRPDLRVYNYGVAGYGPQHILEWFKTPIEKEIPQKKVAVVYTLIQEHLSRAVGTPQLVRWFAGPFPWYEVDESTGHPVRKGVFNDRKTKPTNSGLKILDAVADYRGESLTSEDAKLMAAIIDEARQEFEKKFESDGFYVVVYPGKQTNLTLEVAKILKERGAKILEYRDMLGKAGKGGWYIEGDGHPNPALHAKIAEQIGKDLPNYSKK